VAKKTVGKKKPAPPAVAIQASHPDGEHHVVGIGNLRVVLVPDGDAWFAQGLEIDYAAQGDTVEDAKQQFEDGLVATIEEHLKQHGNIRLLLNVAPNEVWNEMLHEPGAQRKRFSTVSSHHIIKEATDFDGLEFLIPAGVLNAEHV
jgi:hypothetical protein